jgi:hypothetical protein
MAYRVRATPTAPAPAQDAVNHGRIEIARLRRCLSCQGWRSAIDVPHLVRQNGYTTRRKGIAEEGT